MAKLRERIPAIRDARRRNLEIIRKNAVDATRDRDGRCTGSLASSLRFLAVADFILNSDAESFRQQMAQSGKLEIELFERFDRGEGISPSYVTMLAYKSLFALLAAGDFQTAELLAFKMDGRDELSKKFDHPFDRALGHAIQSVVLQRPDAVQRIEELALVCESSKHKDFQGYPRALRALVLSADAEFTAALAEILVGHKRQATTGVFANTEDEVLAVWPLGLINLARHRGMNPNVDDPLIPMELFS